MIHGQTKNNDPWLSRILSSVIHDHFPARIPDPPNLREKEDLCHIKIPTNLAPTNQRTNKKQILKLRVRIIRQHKEMKITRFYLSFVLIN